MSGAVRGHESSAARGHESGAALDGTSTTIGVRGARWRATVDATGRVRGDAAGRARAGGPSARWAVLAEDGWHDPAARPPSLRQRRVLGTPVVETRVKVPGGDVACTAWAAPDRGGVVVLEWRNESPRAVAVAVAADGAPLVAARAASSPDAAGLGWAASTWALPHATTLRAALCIGGTGGTGASRGSSAGATGAAHEAWVVALPDADRVVGAWREVAHGAGRVDLPDPRAAEALVAARCDLVLDDAPARALDDPADALLLAAEAARLREPDRAEPWELAAWCGAVAERVARRARGSAGGPTRREARALAMGAWVLAAAGERDGAADVAALAARLGDTSAHDTTAHDTTVPVAARPVRAIAAISAIEDGLARVAADGAVHVLPDGIPDAWRGGHFEAHGLVAGPGRSISYAVRWHGAAPALLWEVVGDAHGLAIAAPRVDPRFASREPRGETLLRTLDGAAAAPRP